MPLSHHPDVASALRQEVGEFRRGERRRRFPLGVHAGTLGGPRASVQVGWPEPASYDAALRLDMVDALLAQEADTPTGRRHVDVWLTRPGVPELHDLDLAWHAAARHAAGAHGLALAAFHVVTRTGWLDVLTGESRTWKRLRL